MYAGVFGERRSAWANLQGDAQEGTSANKPTWRGARILVRGRRASVSPAGQALGERARDRRRDEVGDIAAEGRHFLHPGRGEEAVVRRGDHVDRLDPRVELAVQLRHLELVLEVGDRPHPLDDRVGTVFARELHQQGGEDLYLDVAELGRRLLDEALALLRGEERLVLA